MKIKHLLTNMRPGLLSAVICALVALFAARASASDIQKADSADTLNLGSSWVLGTPPGGGDNALWDNTVATYTTSSLGDNLSWAGILMGYASATENQPATNIVINGDWVNTLTLGTNGINLRGTTSQSTPTRPNLTINADVILGTNQTWSVYGFSRSITINGNISGAFNLTKGSGGSLTLLGANSFANLGVGGGTVYVGNGGSVGTLGTGPVNIGNGTAVVFNRSDNIIITNSFTGGIAATSLGGRFEKQGAGDLILTSSNTSFYGWHKLTAGTLVISNETQLGNNPGGAALTANALEFNGGTLRAADSFVIDDSKRGIQLDSGKTGNMNVDTAKTLTVSNAITGAGALRKQGNGTLSLAASNSFTGSITVVGGIVRLDHPFGLPGGTAATGGTSQMRFNGGLLGLASGDYTRNLGTTAADTEFVSTGGFAAYGADRLVNLGGTSAQIVWGGAQFLPSGGNLALSYGDATHKVTFANPIDLNYTERTISANNGAAAVDAVLSGVLSNGGLIKSGTGTLALSATNTYTGNTTVSTGTLLVDGQLDQTAVTVNSSTTLGGNGLILGPVSVAGTLAPGESIGTLAVSNDVSITGTLLIEISKNGLATTSDLLRGVTNLTVTGAALTVTNIGPDTLASGNSFTIFKAQTVIGNFGATNLPALAEGFSWDTSQLNAGVITVTGGVTPPTATNLVSSVSAGNLNLSWPAGAGWRLEAQTNALTVGITTNWHNVPVTTNSLAVPLNPANPAVFYRLAWP